jgi:hypothetical protein
MRCFFLSVRNNDGKTIPVVICYSLRFILLDTNIDVCRHILIVDTFILVASNMDRRKYMIYREGTIFLLEFLLFLNYTRGVAHYDEISPIFE